MKKANISDPYRYRRSASRRWDRFCGPVVR